MRWCLSAVLVLVASPVFAQAKEDEAEKLYRAMEKKIKEAKSLKVVFEGKRSPSPYLTIGTVFLAEDNKARLEVQETLNGRIVHGGHLVSDGKQMTQKDSGKEWGVPKETPPKRVEMIMRNLTNWLVADSLRFDPDFQPVENLKRKNPATWSDFKFGAKERVGDREAQIVEYLFSTPSEKEEDLMKFRYQVWIDPKSLTPLKRQVYSPYPPNQPINTEAYTEFIINPQLDPKLFELPK